MPLAAGSQLGPYEIVAPIGAGGMGEVYRARDPRVGRDVAIKVSQERFSERFDREVRVIASLNHPNICQLYDVGPNYLVMELVEGESPHGPMSLDETLRIMRQIADALDYAHEKGVVHRDLKPANIKITPEGAVKVLDFGLAKQSPPVRAGKRIRRHFPCRDARGHDPRHRGLHGSRTSPRPARRRAIFHLRQDRTPDLCKQGNPVRHSFRFGARFVVPVRRSDHGGELHGKSDFRSEKPRVWQAFGLSPDGKRVAVMAPVDSPEAPKADHEVVFLQNFFDELRRRAPVGK